MSDDRTKADKAWEARQEAARYRIFNAATNAAEATDEADDENYFAVLDQAGTPVSTAALNLVGLLDQPTIDNEDIIRVLKFDNVLTAKLLRACNSPFFGFIEPIASVDQAVLILGHQQIFHRASRSAARSGRRSRVTAHRRRSSGGTR